MEGRMNTFRSLHQTESKSESMITWSQKYQRAESFVFSAYGRLHSKGRKEDLG